jgi:hypothetical protein
MYTTIRHELLHARKTWPGTLLDPCLLNSVSQHHPNIQLPSTGTHMEPDYVDCPSFSFTLASISRKFSLGQAPSVLEDPLLHTRFQTAALLC